ncbi:MAG: hypothetical protein ACO1SV_06930 [Fimbriimonas sp.]
MNWLIIALMVIVSGALFRSLRVKPPGRSSLIEVASAYSTGSDADEEDEGEDPAPEPVSRDRYERIVQRFIAGDFSDHLAIWHPADPEFQLTLLPENGEIQILLPFTLPREADRLASLQAALAKDGHAPKNVHRVRARIGIKVHILDYRAPAAPEPILALTDAILSHLQGPSDTLYVRTEPPERLSQIP